MWSLLDIRVSREGLKRSQTQRQLRSCLLVWQLIRRQMMITSPLSSYSCLNCLCCRSFLWREETANEIPTKSSLLLPLTSFVSTKGLFVCDSRSPDVSSNCECFTSQSDCKKRWCLSSSSTPDNESLSFFASPSSRSFSRWPNDQLLIITIFLQSLFRGIICSRVVRTSKVICLFWCLFSDPFSHCCCEGLSSSLLITFLRLTGVTDKRTVWHQQQRVVNETREGRKMQAQW